LKPEKSYTSEKRISFFTSVTLKGNSKHQKALKFHGQNIKLNLKKNLKNENKVTAFEHVQPHNNNIQ
jgi:hypothetical protein